MKAFYDKIDQRIDKWNRIIYVGFTKIIFPVAFTPKILISIYVYINFAIGLNENYALDLPFPMWYALLNHRLLPNKCFAHLFFSRNNSRFPFDTQQPIGYVLAVILQFFMLRYILLFSASLLSMVVGFFFMTISLTKDIENELRLINDCAKIKNHRSKAMKQLCKFIEFHSTLKQLSNFLAVSLMFII